VIVTDAERELLELLIKTCRSVRNPRNPRTRIELAIPAAEWEMKFLERKAKLEKNGKQKLAA